MGQASYPHLSPQDILCYSIFTMEKKEQQTQNAIFQSVYEIKGLLNLLRGDLSHYFKLIGYLLMGILFLLVYTAYRLS